MSDQSSQSHSAARRPRAKSKRRAQPLIRTMKDYWVMFRERWYFGFIAAVVVSSILLVQQLRKPPVYKSTAKLIFENPRPLTALQGAMASERSINLRTYVEQMRSANFRSRVDSSLTPEERETIRNPYLLPDLPPSSQPTASGIMAGALEYLANSTTPIINITATHRDPLASEIIANRYANCLIEFANDSSDIDRSTRTTALETEERRARQRMEEALGKLEEYRRIHNASSLRDDQNIVAREFAAKSQELITTESARIQFETTLKIVEDTQKSGGDITQISYIAGYRGVSDLLSRLDNLRAEKAVLDERYLENHPRIKDLVAQLEATQRQLERNVNEAVTELRIRYNEARQQEARLVAEKDAKEQQVFELDRKAAEYRVLEEQANIAKEQYAEIRRSASEQMIQDTRSRVAISFLDRAGRGFPSSSDLNNAIMQASFFGIALLVGIPIGLGLLDSRLKAAWEIEQFLNQTLLGEIPSISGVGRKERPHIMARELDHGASEAFRGLFGQLQLNSTVDYPKLLLITSTLPGEGKSIIANNLAATFAGHGKKTLMVDCDFRRPNLHVFYGKDNACGIMRWLNAGATLDGPVEENPDLGVLPLKENFFLLRAGGESRRATELFEFEGFTRLMATLKQQFDIVIIDTPPIGVFPDSMLLSRMVDEIIYVCRFNAVNRSKIRKCIERLQTSAAVFSGIVLNALPAGKQSAYYDYYGYGANETKRYKAYYAQRR